MCAAALCLRLLVMPRPPHPALEKVLTAWFNGAELAAAWSAAGRPVSWSQMRRVANQNLEEHEKRQRQRRRDDDESGVAMTMSLATTMMTTTQPRTYRASAAAARPPCHPPSERRRQAGRRRRRRQRRRQEAARGRARSSRRSSGTHPSRSPPLPLHRRRGRLGSGRDHRCAHRPR